MALRIADVLAAKNVAPSTAAQFGSGGRRAVAQLACPERPSRKVETPSHATWTMAMTILAYNAATAQPDRTEAEMFWIAGVGR